MKRIIAVAHPQDLVFFTSVLAGAEVVVVRGAVSPQLEEAARALGVKRVRAVANADSVEAEAGAELYTCSPLDKNRAHQDLASALAMKHGRVLVPGAAPPFAAAQVLDAAAFDRKLELLNRLYEPASGCDFDATEIRGAETFAAARPEDLGRARSLTHFEQVSEVDDTWSFEQSAYERERYQHTLRLIGAAEAHFPVQTVLELGACEGLMTGAIAARYPRARITAVEPHPLFERTLRARAKAWSTVEVSSASANEVPLQADLIVAAEVLYYVSNQLPRLIGGSRARAWVTSYHGGFDRELAVLFESLGWRSAEVFVLPPRYERLLGAAASPTPFVVRRVGCTVRLWLR